MCLFIARIVARTCASVGALAFPRFQPSTFLTESQHCIEEKVFCSPLHQTRTEFTQYAGVKTGISQLQSQQIFPVDATSHGIRSLPVGEVFHELQHGNQSQAPRSLNCSAIMRKERGKRLILVDRSKCITDRG